MSVDGMSSLTSIRGTAHTLMIHPVCETTGWQFIAGPRLKPRRDSLKASVYTLSPMLNSTASSTPQNWLQNKKKLWWWQDGALRSYDHLSSTHDRCRSHRVHQTLGFYGTASTPFPPAKACPTRNSQPPPPNSVPSLLSPLQTPLPVHKSKRAFLNQSLHI